MANVEEWEALLGRLEAFRQELANGQRNFDDLPPPVAEREDVETAFNNLRGVLARATDEEIKEIVENQPVGPLRIDTTTDPAGSINYTIHIQFTREQFYPENLKQTLLDILRAEQGKNHGIRVQMTYSGLFESIKTGELRDMIMNATTITEINSPDQIPQVLREQLNELTERTNLFRGRLVNETETGYTLIHTDEFELEITPFNPFPGDSFIPTPKNLAVKKCCFNFDNGDETNCFCYAVAYSMFAEFYPEADWRVKKTYQPFFERLDFNGLTYPVSLNQIRYFEERNNVRINKVWQWREDLGKAFPVFQSTFEPNEGLNLDRHRIISLVLIGKLSGNFHYLGMKNPDGAVRRLINNADSHKTLMCVRCNRTFREAQGKKEKNQTLEKHDCVTDGSRARMEAPRAITSAGQ